MKPGNPPLQSTRVLDQLRERIRYRHYSLSTEQVYVYWVRFFIRWSARNGQMQHPRNLEVLEVEAFLSMLATDRRVWPLFVKSFENMPESSMVAAPGRHQNACRA